MGRKQKQETNSATLFRMHLVRNLSFLIFLLFSLCWSSSSSLALFFFCQPCPFHKTTTLCICGLDMEDVFSCSCQFSSCGLTIERSRRRSPALINLTSLFVIWIKNAEKCLHDIDLWSLIFVFSDIEKSGFDFFLLFFHSFLLQEALLKICPQSAECFIKIWLAAQSSACSVWKKKVSQM